MPESSPAFFRGDRQPRWQSTLVGCWLWIRLKFHQSPGFAIAAIAGTLGLALCLVVFLNGGATTWFRGQTAADEEIDGGEQVASLGDADAGDAAAKLGAANDDLGYDRLAATSKTAVKPPAGQYEPDADDNLFDGQPFARPVVENRPLRRSTVRDKPAAVETSAEEPELEMTLPGRPGRIAITPPEVVADEPALSASEPDPDDGAAFLTRMRPAREAGEAAKPDDAKENGDEEAVPLVVDRRPAQRDAASGFLLDDEPQVEKPIEPASTEVAEPAPPRDPASDVESTPLTPVEPAVQRAVASEEAAATEEADADIVPRSPPGWKNAPQTPVRRRPAPPMPLAEQSDEVQTTIHAAPALAAEPEPREHSPIEPAAAQVQPNLAPVRIEVRAPSPMAAGRTYELEIIIINLAETAVNDAFLSIYLPAGLQHSLGAEVERSLGALRARELRRARLTVHAVAEGPYVVQAEVTARGRVAARLSTTVGTRKSGTSLSRGAADCSCAPVR